jgi:DNA-directed RNA polymerase sigma subunit (sigma70/sigma32)
MGVLGQETVSIALQRIGKAAAQFIKVLRLTRTHQITPRYKHIRNALIRMRFDAGETLEELARVFGISHQRVHQIVKQRHH